MADSVPRSPIPNESPLADAQAIGSGFSAKLCCIILAVISFLIYANTLLNGYALDDATVITGNTIVTQGFKGIPELMTSTRLEGFGRSNDRESYRPVPMITHAIEYGLFGESPAISHFVNIALFICCVIALFTFLNNLFAREKSYLVFVASLVFALHPIHTEVVANIKSRDELLCFLFAFLALGMFITYARQGKITALIAGVIMLFLSFLSKETSICFLAIVPLVFFFYINENKKRSIFITGAALVALLSFLAIRAAVLGDEHSNAIVFLANPLISAPGADVRIATAILSLGLYLKLLLLPCPLISDYSYNSIPLAGFDNPYVLLSVAVYIALIVLAISRLLKKSKDPLAFGILFFLMSLALFSNIPFLVYSQFAERFLFFASTGFCIAAAFLAELLFTRMNEGARPQITSRKTLAVLIPVGLILAVLTIMRNSEWKDNYTLFSADVKKAADNAKLQFFMGSTIAHEVYAKETDPQRRVSLDNESLDYLRKAIAIYPDYGEAHAEAGVIFDRLQLFDSGMVHDEKAIVQNPDNAIATYNLARAYYALKKYPGAITMFKRSLVFNPEFALASLNLARCYIDYGGYDSAIVYFNKTLALDPNIEIARQGLAYAMQMRAAGDTVHTKAR